MKAKIKKEKADKRITVRFTEEEFKTVTEKADELGMKDSSYIRDRVINGKERNIYAKRKMCTALVTVNHCIDQLHDSVLSMDGDSISKKELIGLIEKMRKECALK